CVDVGGRMRKCRRQTLKKCRAQGVVFCAPPQTVDVATAGVDGPSCGGADAPCRTIQYVLDNLIPLSGSGTLDVAAGTYARAASCPIGTTPNQAAVCIINRQITLRGGFVPPDWSTPGTDPAATVIDAGGQRRGVRIHRGAAVEAPATLDLEGVTIANGLAQ